MYDWLLRLLPPRWAGAALVVWYLALLLLLFFAWHGEEPVFRYGRL